MHCGRLRLFIDVECTAPDPQRGCWPQLSMARHAGKFAGNHICPLSKTSVILMEQTASVNGAQHIVGEIAQVLFIALGYL
jgi:hypothetical protein